MAGFPFFCVHLAGLTLGAGLYTPFAYNATCVRTEPLANSPCIPYDFCWDETTAYARYTREIWRAEWFGPDLASYRPYVLDELPTSSRWYRDRLGPMILALLASALPGHVPAAFMAADFIFPALLFFTFLALCRQLSFSLYFSLFTTSLVVWFNWWDLLGLVYLLRGLHPNGPVFLRTAYPQISATLFVLFLMAFVRLQRRPSMTSAALAAGALVVNFYTYVYSWTLALSMLLAGSALLLVPYVGPMLSGFGERRKLLPLCGAATAVAIVMAFPVWLHLATASAVTNDSFVRWFGVLTHRPDLKHGLPFALLLAVTLVGARLGWNSGWFWSAFWLASMGVVNQQVITGKVLQPEHFLGFYMEPLALLWLCDLGRWLMTERARAGFGFKPARLARPLALATMALGLGLGFYRSAREAWDHRAHHRQGESFRDVVRLLRDDSFRQYGFLTNDSYLDQILPAHIPLKPLRPWFTDPLSNQQMELLHEAASHLLAGAVGRAITGGSTGAPAIRLNPGRTLLILNRHRLVGWDLSNCRLLLDNSDFVVALLPVRGVAMRMEPHL